MNVVNQKERMGEPALAPKAGTKAAWLILIGIIFIAVNLRAPLTSVGPVVELIRDDLQLSNTLAGMITTLPLLAFAVFSPFVPKLSQRYGIEWILFVSIILLTIGVLFRTFSGTAALYIGTAVLGMAIAACNVLLPGLIKREFPERIGLMTGVYSIAMNFFGAVATGIGIPIAVGLGFGWQGALGVWGVLSFLAILVWIPQVKRSSRPKAATQQTAGSKGINLWKSALAWQVTLFMGLQSTMFYVLVAWLPEILKAQGISFEQSGWLVSVMQFIILPVTFIAPILAGKMKNQQLLVSVTSACFFAGIIGLLYGSIKLAIVWVILLGLGSGLAFGLAMIFFSLRTANAVQAAELSGMAQSVGYLLAAMAPMFFGYLYDLLHSWTTPLLILAGVSLLLFAFGLGAGRDRYVASANDEVLK